MTGLSTVAAAASEATADAVALNPLIRDRERIWLHALLQSADYGILLTSLDRQDLLANRRLGEMFAVDPQSVVETPPQTVRELARSRVRHPEAFSRRVDEIFADPDMTAEDDIELADTAGAAGRVLRRYTGPVRDGEARPIGRLWSFVDVSETRRLAAELEANLAARTAEFRATVEVLRLVNALCRLATTEIPDEALVSQVAGLLRGAPGVLGVAVLLTAAPDALTGSVGTSGRAGIHPVRVACGSLLTSLADAAPGGLSLSRLPDLRATLGWNHGRALPLRTGGEPCGLLAVQLERTGGVEPRQRAFLCALADQVALTVETHRLNAELRAALASLRGTHLQLVESERLGATGALAASVAHDIRNILSALQTELSLGGVMDRHSLQMHLDRFAALTQRLLSFSKPKEPALAPLDLHGVAARALSLLAGQAELSGVAMHVSAPADLPDALGDEQQLELVFVNLCLNSIQAMTSGGTLTVEITAKGGSVSASVRDTGPGIPFEDRRRLFEPFYTTRTNGTGLGLFSSRRILQEMQGSLDLADVDTGGAAFVLRIPRA